MNFKFLLSVAVLATIVGCGKNKNSSGNAGIVSKQGTCSVGTLDLHATLLRKSEKPITRQTQVNEISQSCNQLALEMGNQSCPVTNRSNRVVQYATYNDVAGYCAEIETYVSQTSPSPRPVPPPAPSPEPTTPTPRPRPPVYGNILVEDLDSRYALYFKRFFLSEADVDLRNSITRCRLSVSNRSNTNLKNVRASLVTLTVETAPSGAVYDMTAKLNTSRELVRLTCRSHNLRLNVRDLNLVLSEVAEIRLR